MERYKAILIAVGVVLGVALVVIFGVTHLVHVKPALSSQERQLAQYQYQKVEITERKPAVFSGLKNPMGPAATAAATASAGASRKDYPAESLSALAPQGGGDPKGAPALSLILLKEGKRMAIINGEVVKEGDRTASGKVLRITRSGVLVKNTEGERWIKIE